MIGPRELGRVHVVLLRTRDPQNLGSVARAMKNCGLTRLTLVAPRTEDLVTARRVSVHAEALLAAPRVVSTLGEAVTQVVWVVGTSSRLLPGRRRLVPEEVAIEASARSRKGEVALVFGDEESGLSNADLLACHAVSTIPTVGDQPSLNLAQAVLVYGYELVRASDHSSIPEPSPDPRWSPATERELARIERTLRQVLEASRFADPERPGHSISDIMGPLRRAGLTRGEASLWGAALGRVSKTVSARAASGKETRRG